MIVFVFRLQLQLVCRIPHAGSIWAAECTILLRTRHSTTFQSEDPPLIFWFLVQKKISYATKDRPKHKPRGKSSLVYDVLLYSQRSNGEIKGSQLDYWSSVDARKMVNHFYWGLDSMKKVLRSRWFSVAQILKWIFASKSTPFWPLCDLANKPLTLNLFSNIVLFPIWRQEALSIESSTREGELHVRSKQWYQTYAENGTERQVPLWALIEIKEEHLQTCRLEVNWQA
jgi:hypothetical protein